MNNSRRSFLQTSCLTAVSGLLAGGMTRAAGAIEPIARSDGPLFKFSLAAYSYRSLLTKKQLTLSDFIADCAKFGLQGTELTSYYFPNPAPANYLRQLKHECFLAGLDVSGTAVGNDFCQPEGEQRKQQIESVKRWIDNAEILGAPVIRIFSGNAKEGMTAAEAHRLAVAGMEECCEYAGQHGVFLALENHGGLTATVDGMLKLIEDVKSPWFGVNMDTGNFHTDDIYGDLAKIAPYSINVQVKVVISGPNRKKEPTNYRRLAEILKAAGYRGYIVLEYEEAGDPREECPKVLDELARRLRRGEAHSASLSAGRKLGCSRALLGSLSESLRIFNPERLREVIEDRPPPRVIRPNSPIYNPSMVVGEAQRYFIRRSIEQFYHRRCAAANVEWLHKRLGRAAHLVEPGRAGLGANAF